MIRPALALLLASGLLAGAAGGAVAEDWPIKPIRAVVPLAPGTGGDVMSRIVLNQLSVQLNQPIVIENKGGAGGTIGANMVARAEPDGYTLLSNTIAHAIAPAIYPNLPYDVSKDFAAVIPIGNVPSALVVSPSKGFKTVGDLVAAAKAKPGTLTYASAGVGSSTHLTAERMLQSAGITAIHVPFRGGGFQPEIIAGRVDFAYSPIATCLPNIKEGNLQALAVSGAKRASSLPDVPTTLEAGFTDSDYVIWVGLFFPAKTPREIVDRLHDEAIKALQSPTVRERFAQLDVEPMPMSPAEFDQLIRKEIVSNAALARAVGLKAD